MIKNIFNHFGVASLSEFDTKARQISRELATHYAGLTGLNPRFNLHESGIHKDWLIYGCTYAGVRKLIVELTYKNDEKR